MSKQFFGKYRGVVTNNKDDENRGRIRARVKDVFGDKESPWALPCVPYAGPGVGLFLIPPKEAFVWIEFEHGNPDYPVWSGCFWAPGEVPVSNAIPEKKVLRTDIATITVDDTRGAGGITIETNEGMKISINTSGIEIDDGKGGTVKLSGPKVSINDTALEVT